MVYLRESAEAKFEGSLKLLAEYYEKGEFGLPVNPQKAASLRAEAEGDRHWVLNCRQNDNDS